jgi:hypothetical protein
MKRLEAKKAANASYPRRVDQRAKRRTLCRRPEVDRIAAHVMDNGRSHGFGVNLRRKNGKQEPAAKKQGKQQ